MAAEAAAATGAPTTTTTTATTLELAAEPIFAIDHQAVPTDQAKGEEESHK